MGLQSLENRFFLDRSEVGRWHSDIGRTVGPSQQQLGFLFSWTQIAFMYAYWYRPKMEWTFLKHTVTLGLYFLLAGMLVRQKMFVILLLLDKKKYK